MTFLPSGPPPAEDSEDFTEEEVKRSTPTTSEKELAKALALELAPGHASIGKQDARFALKKHELRRRNGHLYTRVTLGCPGEPDKVLTFQIDWLQRGQEYESV